MVISEVTIMPMKKYNQSTFHRMQQNFRMIMKLNIDGVAMNIDKLAILPE